ncbi:MAG: tRNA uridine-5-carboxymethylaminomethyl(34) synthesis GTPase MnmE [Sporomusaceae bacterium]|nr:tRNA uridine-5-carboxymethylaminomethyl(34) synthesis GTPase MnmE [Sporomusaceae bacterium]
MSDDTISAVATAAGEGGIGIIRISGAAAIGIAGQLFSGVNGRTAAELKPFQAAYGRIADPVSGDVIDEALLLVMKAPHSYTREDVVEIHCHGGGVALRRILDLTFRLGSRPAEPGEFTKRAFLNGRLDLSQAEAVIDVIRAKSDASLRVAVSHLGGAMAAEVGSMRQHLLELIAHLEATIDFPEEDIDEPAMAAVVDGIVSLAVQTDRLLSTADTGRILRDGLSTVIIGKPNVGKSSLLNALVREERAIVTAIPGTTRDMIEEYVTVRGIPLRLIDTAGIRPTEDLVERIGVERARAVTGQADLLILMLDRSQPLSAEDREVLRLLTGRTAIILLNKSDLPPQWDAAVIGPLAAGHSLLEVSVLNREGLDRLEDEIVRLVYSGQAVSEGAFVTSVRHLNCLREVQRHLQSAQEAAAVMPADCVVIDLRSAWEALGKISGDTVGEDIIDEIFSRFCIGK